MQAWRGNNISPEVWGWAASFSGLVPIQMVQPAAPERLLKVIRCNSGGQCDREMCTYRRNRLQSTPVCGQCKGITRMNVSEVESWDISDEQDADQDNIGL